MKSYKYLSMITTAYVVMQLVADVTAGKIIQLGPFSVSVAVIYFPVTYIFADILTEVYGYARARKAVWTVLSASVMAGCIYQLAVYLPSASGFNDGLAYARVLGVVPRVLVGGWIAVWAGGVCNDFVLAKMKVWTSGKHLWMRTIGSTIIGEGVNTLLFYTIALYAILPMNLLAMSIVSSWCLKVLIEAMCTPITYYIIHRVKQAEQEDYYDRETDFNPFQFERDYL